jgi:hypothetical protein
MHKFDASWCRTLCAEAGTMDFIMKAGRVLVRVQESCSVQIGPSGTVKSTSSSNGTIFACFRDSFLPSS